MLEAKRAAEVELSHKLVNNPNLTSVLQLEYKQHQLEMNNKTQEVMSAKQKIEMQTYELELVKAELKELRESNKSLDTTKFSQEKSITEYSVRMESLQREIDDK